MIRKIATKALIGYKSISERIIKARFHINYGKMTIFQVNAPALTAKDEDLEKFYEMLQDEIKQIGY